VICCKSCHKPKEKEALFTARAKLFTTARGTHYNSTIVPLSIVGRYTIYTSMPLSASVRNAIMSSIFYILCNISCILYYMYAMYKARHEYYIVKKITIFTTLSNWRQLQCKMCVRRCRAIVRDDLTRSSYGSAT
jgi:hypothetical protein